MNNNNFDYLTYLKDLLTSDNKEGERTWQLGLITKMAVEEPEKLKPEAIFFIGSLLQRLIDNGYDDARKSMGLTSVNDKRKFQTRTRQIQLIADVDYLYERRNLKGAQGAIELLCEQSPYYKGKDSNSLQVNYRNSIKDLVNWFSSVDGGDADFDGMSTAIEKGKVIKKNLLIFVKNRDPLI